MHLENIKSFFGNYYMYLLSILFIIYFIVVVSLNINRLNLEIEKNPNDNKLITDRNYKIAELSLCCVFIIPTFISAILRPTDDKILKFYDILYIIPVLLLLLSILWTVQTPNISNIIVVCVTSCVLVWRITESVKKNEYWYSDKRLNRIPNPNIIVQNI